MAIECWLLGGGSMTDSDLSVDKLGSTEPGPVSLGNQYPGGG